MCYWFLIRPGWFPSEPPFHNRRRTSFSPVTRTRSGMLCAISSAWNLWPVRDYICPLCEHITLLPVTQIILRWYPRAILHFDRISLPCVGQDKQDTIVWATIAGPCTSCWHTLWMRPGNLHQLSMSGLRVFPACAIITPSSDCLHFHFPGTFIGVMFLGMTLQTTLPWTRLVALSVLLDDTSFTICPPDFFTTSSTIPVGTWSNFLTSHSNREHSIGWKGSTADHLSVLSTRGGTNPFPDTFWYRSIRSYRRSPYTVSGMLPSYCSCVMWSNISSSRNSCLRWPKQPPCIFLGSNANSLGSV